MKLIYYTSQRWVMRTSITDKSIVLIIECFMILWKYCLHELHMQVFTSQYVFTNWDVSQTVSRYDSRELVWTIASSYLIVHKLCPTFMCIFRVSFLERNLRFLGGCDQWGLNSIGISSSCSWPSVCAVSFSDPVLNHFHLIAVIVVILATEKAGDCLHLTDIIDHSCICEKLCPPLLHLRRFEKSISKNFLSLNALRHCKSQSKPANKIWFAALIVKQSIPRMIRSAWASELPPGIQCR